MQRIAIALLLAVTSFAHAQTDGWLEWRGPHQNGVSDETNLPDTVDPDAPLWTFDRPGAGTAVLTRNRLYVMGYAGEGSDLLETLTCLNPGTGEVIWEKQFADFLSDIIYNRYSIGAPSIDPETGNVYAHTSPGILIAFDADGHELWQRSLMEEFGRLTFPNGRTGAPAIDGDLVIINAITSNWGREGPARNRFYAFDKTSGELVWSSDPGVGPPFLKDSSFSTPYFETRGNQRVFYATLGDGNIVGVNALTGEPLWRHQVSIGGMNSSVVVRDDTLVAIHGKENVEDSGRGFMLALDISKQPGEDGAYANDARLWRNDKLSMFTSSPTLVGDRVYQCTVNGDFYCIDVATGKVAWKLSLGNSQLHASPVYADGKLYVPMWDGHLYIIRPHADRGEILCNVKLEGLCIGSPSVYNGRVYVHTTHKLYCFGNANGGKPVASPAANMPSAGPPAALQPVPAEVILKPGDTKSIFVRVIDENGMVVGSTFPSFRGGSMVKWEPWIPPTARVKVQMDGRFDDHGNLVVSRNADVSAGAFKATSGDFTGEIRGRVLAIPPFSEDFESFKLNDEGWAFPPLPWIGARLKWQVQNDNGNQCLVKTLDRVLFQRSMVFIGHPDASNYTIEALVKTDGNRRLMSTVGLINQRYIVQLDGNKQQLACVSNYDRMNVAVPFAWQPGKWYHLKARVDVNDDGSGVVRGKAWAKGDPEPDGWLLNAETKLVHTHGAAGVFGFSPQSRFPVYVDDVKVTSNAQ